MYIIILLGRGYLVLFLGVIAFLLGVDGLQSILYPSVFKYFSTVSCWLLVLASPDSLFVICFYCCFHILSMILSFVTGPSSLLGPSGFLASSSPIWGL